MKGHKTQRNQDGGIGNAKKCKRTLKKVENLSNNSINRMDEAFLRFPHLPEQIFDNLDFESLTNARLVAKSWKEFIDVRERRWYPFKKFKNEIADLKKECGSDETPFHFACWNGKAGLAEIIIKNSAKLNIDLNAKDSDGRTAFHWACWMGHAKIAETIMKNSAEFNIDLNAKTFFGRTAFHWACSFGRT